VAAAAGAAALVVALLLPPSAARLAPVPRDQLELMGALHVHTQRSDGAGTLEDVAAAASDAGLQFVVLADHGDATRPAEPPRYIGGVLCIDAVEVGTQAGHYLALGLERAAPYPLGGEPRDVVDDVQRLGGFGLVSHPDSPRPALRWRAWSAPIDGLEWLNADSEWRDEPGRSLARALATYFVRPPESIASLFDRPATLERWDALTRRRRVIAVAGHDAHARIGRDPAEEPAAGEYALRLPSYAAVFRTFAQRVRLDEPATGDAKHDARLVLSALRAGHTYTVVDAYASPARLTFEAQSASGAAQAGDDVVASTDVTLSARVPSAPGIALVLLQNGRVIKTEAGPSLVYVHQPSASPAVYRVEARVETGRQVPWIVSNPIWVLDQTRPAPARLDPPPAVAVLDVLAGRQQGRWTLERDPATKAATEIATAPWGSAALRLSFELAGGAPRGQYAAAVAAVTPTPGWDRVRFKGAATPEMRVSVQVREPRGGRRWKRSVVLGEAPREIGVRLDEMSFAEPVLAGRPPRDEIESLLFVVDTVNTRPGTAGTAWIGDVRLELEAKALRSAR
jgi:hypothetical protein